MNDLLYVIILNYNHLNDLIETIESFKIQDYSNFKLVVIDNNSTDNSVQWISNTYPEILVIKNRDNFGWAKGNNEGIKQALMSDSDFILLANNDLKFEDKNIISKLMQTLNSYPKFGIIGPSQYSYYDRNCLLNEGWVMYPKAKYSFNKYRTNMKGADFDRKYKIVDNVSGSFMIIRSVLFDKIGLLDENFFLYSEDTDFSLRAWKAGYYSAVDRTICIYHKVSATAGKNSPLKAYYKTRNLLYLIKKHKGSQENHLYFFLIYMIDLIKSCFKLILRLNQTDALFQLKACVIGALHGIFNRMNRYY